MDIIKQKFIEDTLRDEGRRLKANQGRALRKVLKFHSHRIINDRKVEIVSTRSQNDTLRFTVPHYTRMLDIKKERRNKRGSGRSRKSFKIYNRFVMGAYYSIAHRLSNDFTEEVQRNIRLNFSRRGGNNV